MGRFNRILRLGFTLATTLLLALLLSACSLQAMPDLEQVLAQRPSEGASTTVAPAVIRVRDLPSISAQPSWGRNYRGQVAANITEGSQATLVYGEAGAGGQPGIDMVSADGKRRWRQTLPASGESAVRVSSRILDNRVIALTRGHDQPSQAYAYDGQGKQLWRRPVTGGSQAVMSADGGRIAFADRQTGLVSLVNGSGRELSRLQLGAGVRTAFVDDTHWLLLTDQRRVQLAAADGSIAWQYENPDPLNWKAAVSLADGLIGVTTGQPDSAVYMFDEGGDARWVHLLMPGGDNEPIFNAANEVLYVYDVGDEAGVSAYAVEGGEVQWRLAFAAPAGYRPKIQALRIAGGGAPMVMHYVETPLSGGSTASGKPAWQALIWVSPQGKALAHLPLPSVRQAALSRDGGRLVTSQPVARSGFSSGTAIRYYDLKATVGQQLAR